MPSSSSEHGLGGQTRPLSPAPPACGHGTGTGPSPSRESRAEPPAAASPCLLAARSTRPWRTCPTTGRTSGSSRAGCAGGWVGGHRWSPLPAPPRQAAPCAWDGGVSCRTPLGPACGLGTFPSTPQGWGGSWGDSPGASAASRQVEGGPGQEDGPARVGDHGPGRRAAPAQLPPDGGDGPGDGGGGEPRTEIPPGGGGGVAAGSAAGRGAEVWGRCPRWGGSLPLPHFPDRSHPFLRPTRPHPASPSSSGRSRSWPR